IPAVATKEDEPKAALAAAHRPEGAKGTGKENGKEEAKPPALPAADQLLDKYVQALGGASAIDAVTSRVMKGTITAGGESTPIEIYGKDPEKRISYTRTANGDSI